MRPISWPKSSDHPHTSYTQSRNVELRPPAPVYYVENLSAEPRDTQMGSQPPMPSTEAGPYRRTYWRTLTYCMVVALSPILFGLDQAALNGTIVIRTFQERFGSRDPTTGGYIMTATQQTTLLAVFLAGAWIAAVVSGHLGTIFGRKAGFYCCVVTAILGAVIQIVATNIGVAALGRLVSGAGLGFAACFCGVYWSEVAPAHWRGVML